MYAIPPIREQLRSKYKDKSKRIQYLVQFLKYYLARGRSITSIDVITRQQCQRWMADGSLYESQSVPPVSFWADLHAGPLRNHRPGSSNVAQHQPCYLSTTQRSTRHRRDLSNFCLGFGTVKWQQNRAHRFFCLTGSTTQISRDGFLKGTTHLFM